MHPFYQSLSCPFLGLFKDIKSIDSNHMVSVGDEGFFNRGGDWTYNGGEGKIYCYYCTVCSSNLSGGDFDAFIAAPNIDYGTFHIYIQDWGKDDTWGQQWIADHIASTNSAGVYFFLKYGPRAVLKSTRQACSDGRIWMEKW